MKTFQKIPQTAIEEILEKRQITDLAKATIREIVGIANELEVISNQHFIRMEMGVPGLKPSSVGVNAEIKALRSDVAALYPSIEGIPEVKEATSSFLKAFANIEIPPTCCIPVVGSMQGSYATFLSCLQSFNYKKKILFIDPGFPVQKQQINVMGGEYISFDVYDYRGEKLREKLNELVNSHEICSIVYSNPNNPSWICFTEQELKIIAEIAEKHNIVIIEDLAYFGMDFRADISVPFQSPYQISIAQYSSNYIILLSGSKAFSYAGQRIGMVCMSEKIFNQEYAAFKEKYGVTKFGQVFIHRILYALSSGTSHSAQHALAAMLEEAHKGNYSFIQALYPYRDRAKRMKQVFLKNGFHIVYDKDGDQELADGFYFTVGYGEMNCSELMLELMSYGISAISLSNTGSKQEGVRACVSFVKEEEIEELNKRLQALHLQIEQRKEKEKISGNNVN